MFAALLVQLIDAGVAARDITPPMKYPMSGYYHERLSTGVRDPLFAKALVFRQGGTQAALVICDVCAVSMELTNAARRRASEKTGIPAENIVVAATHSHTGPDYRQRMRRFTEKGEDDGYVASLIERVADAVADAHAGARLMRLQAGTGQQETEVAFNRRFVMKDGTIKTWANYKDPDVVRAAGPIDPEVAVLMLRHLQGAPRAALINFALHLDTTGGTEFSADYPHPLERTLRRDLGEGFLSIFGTGCCGDINHVNPRADKRNSAEEIGTALASTVRRAIPELRELKASLAVSRAVVKAPLQECTPADLEWAAGIIAKDSRAEKIPFLDEVKAYKLKELDRLRKIHGETLPLEVHAIRLAADAAIVTLPGEVFVEHALAIKKGSPFKTTLVIELANAAEPGYIPTREQIAGGGYEVINGVLKPGGGELLVEAALRLLK